MRTTSRSNADAPPVGLLARDMDTRTTRRSNTYTLLTNLLARNVGPRATHRSNADALLVTLPPRNTLERRRVVCNRARAQHGRASRDWPKRKRVA
eukprot:958702-Lingulodinium_polyedra.AAC.1